MFMVSVFEMYWMVILCVILCGGRFLLVGSISCMIFMLCDLNNAIVWLLFGLFVLGWMLMV